MLIFSLMQKYKLDRSGGLESSVFLDQECKKRMEDVSEKASYITFESQSVLLVSHDLKSGNPSKYTETLDFFQISESYGCLSRPDTPHLFDIDWWLQVSVHQRLKLLQKAKQNFHPKRLALKSSGLRIRVSP